jgi:signal peptidase II
MPSARAGLPWAAAVAAAVLAFDQWTKAVIQSALGPAGSRGSVPVAGDWFLIEYAQNRGVAFGALADRPVLAPLLALAMLLALVVYAVRAASRGPWLVAGIGLVGGGAVGNLIDRLRFGYVIDFVAIGPWPNFNVADAAICVGVVCLAIDALVRPEPEGTGVRRAAGG